MNSTWHMRLATALPAALTLLLMLMMLLILAQPVLAGRILTACGHPFYPPVSWHHNNRLTGVAPAVTRQLFAELGYQVQLSADSNWKRCLHEVERGRVDLIVAAFRTRQRQRWLDFTQQPIIADHITLFSRHNSQPSPTTPTRHLPSRHYPPLERLRQQTVGLLLGDSFGDDFDRFVQKYSQIEHVSQGRQNFTKLALGRIDYMPIGQLTGQLQSQKLGYADQLQAIEPAITTEYYYLALGKHSQLQALLPYLNRRLAEMQSDGTLQRLVQQYSLEYLDPPP
ncbi:MAG: transporter substrate-binding domain-containing protein [Marinobacterium sp.]|nr:transporter substrate-binding domain-containing protein [Marinobacterium sp.]